MPIPRDHSPAVASCRDRFRRIPPSRARRPSLHRRPRFRLRLAGVSVAARPRLRWSCRRLPLRFRCQHFRRLRRRTARFPRRMRKSKARRQGDRAWIHRKRYGRLALSIMRCSLLRRGKEGRRRDGLSFNITKDATWSDISITIRVVYAEALGGRAPGTRVVVFVESIGRIGRRPWSCRAGSSLLRRARDRSVEPAHRAPSRG